MLASGKLLDLAPGEGQKIEEFHGARHGLIVATGEGAEEPHMGVASHLHESTNRDGEIPVHGIPLGEVGQQGGGLGEVALPDPDGSCLGGQEAGHGLEER